MTVTIELADIEKEIARAKKGKQFGATTFHNGRLDVLESLLYGKLTEKEALKVKHRGAILAKKLDILKDTLQTATMVANSVNENSGDNSMVAATGIIMAGLIIIVFILATCTTFFDKR